MCLCIMHGVDEREKSGIVHCAAAQEVIPGLRLSFYEPVVCTSLAAAAIVLGVWDWHASVDHGVTLRRCICLGDRTVLESHENSLLSSHWL